MQGIFQKENTDKALKYGIYRHLPTYEKIIRNLVSFYIKNNTNALPKAKSTDTHDFGEGSISGNILRLAIPMTLAQLINVLYNIIDRIYIGHLPDVSTQALTGIGLTLPVITIITAFTNR